MAEIPIFLALGGLVGFMFAENEKTDKLTGKPQYDITEFRNPDSLSRKTRKIIDLITIQEHINPVGSMKYKIQKYPSDIDVFEKYQTCCDLNSASIEIAGKLMAIGKQIRDANSIYFGDFKAGLDDRYDIRLDLGKIDYSTNEIIDFDRGTITEHLSDLLEKKLLSEKEYSELIFLVYQPFKFINYEKIIEILKSKRTVRWTLDELINGEKILIGGQKLTLEEAITHKSVVKLDVWSQIEGDRYTEITNFFIFVYSDLKGKQHVMNLELGDLIESFMKDIILYSTLEHKKSMKVAKRMWQLATYVGYTELLNKLYPLFQSDIGILNQIGSDIEVLIAMLTKLKNPPLGPMIKEIDEFKFRLSTFNEVPLEEDFIFDLIDNITHNYDKHGKNMDIETLIINLSHLREYLLGIVEDYSSKYLSENGINQEELMQYIEKYRLKNKI